MKSILIVNLHSAQNAGDYALLQLSLAELHAHFPQHTITLSANDPASFRLPDQRERVIPSFFYWMQGASSRPIRILSSFWLFVCSILAALVHRTTGRIPFLPVPAAQRESIRAYFDAGLVASCPGNFLYSRSYQAGLPLLLTIYTIAYAWVAGKPIFMLPQTIGPIRRRWERLILAWLLHRVQMILVRDSLSRDYLQELGIPDARCFLLADMAFQPPSEDISPGLQLLREFAIDPDLHRPLLGLTAINWGAQDPAFTDQEAYETALADTIQRFLQEQQGYAVIFAQVCGPTPADDDRIPARRIKAQLANSEVASRVVVADGVFPPAALRAAYAQVDLFIGSRLHSNIFALSEEIPVLAIAYQMKTLGVMQMLDMAEWVIDIDRVDQGRLSALYSRIWPERQALRAQIPGRVGQIICQRQDTLRTVYSEMAAVLGKGE